MSKEIGNDKQLKISNSNIEISGDFEHVDSIEIEKWDDLTGKGKISKGIFKDKNSGRVYSGELKETELKSLGFIIGSLIFVHLILLCYFVGYKEKVESYLLITVFIGGSALILPGIFYFILFIFKLITEYSSFRDVFDDMDNQKKLAYQIPVVAIIVIINFFALHSIAPYIERYLFILNLQFITIEIVMLFLFYDIPNFIKKILTNKKAAIIFVSTSGLIVALFFILLSLHYSHIKTFKIFSNIIQDINISQDGKYLVANDVGDRLAILSVEELKLKFLKMEEAYGAGNISSNENYLFIKERIFNLRSNIMYPLKYTGMYPIDKYRFVDDRLILVEKRGYGDSEYTIASVWDFKNRRLLALRNFAGETIDILTNNNCLTTFDKKNKTVFIWDVFSGQLQKRIVLKELNGYCPLIKVFLLNKNTLIIQYIDNSYNYIIDYKSLKIIKKLNFEILPEILTITDDKKFIIAKSSNGLIHIIKANNFKKIASISCHPNMTLLNGTINKGIVANNKLLFVAEDYYLRVYDFKKIIQLSNN